MIQQGSLGFWLSELELYALSNPMFRRRHHQLNKPVFDGRKLCLVGNQPGAQIKCKPWKRSFRTAHRHHHDGVLTSSISTVSVRSCTISSSWKDSWTASDRGIITSDTESVWLCTWFFAGHWDEESRTPWFFCISTRQEVYPALMNWIVHYKNTGIMPCMYAVAEVPF